MRIINYVFVSIITFIICSCEIEKKKVEDITVFHYDLSSDTTKIIDKIILNRRIIMVADIKYDFYHLPEQQTVLKFIFGRFEHDDQRIRFSNDTCDLIASKKYNLKGKEIEILKYSLDNLKIADDEAYIYYSNGIGLIAYYFYVGDGMFYLEYEETSGLQELFLADTSGFVQ